MSYTYTVKIQGPDRSHEYVTYQDVGEFRMYLALRPVYRDILPGPYAGGGRHGGQGFSSELCGLPGVSGLPCKEATIVLCMALTELLDREEELPSSHGVNQENIEDVVSALSLCLTACIAYRGNPQARISVWW